MSKVDGMTPDEAVEIVMNALADLPSGPPAREILEVIQAQAWEEGEQAGAMNHASEEYPEVEDITNPYRSQA